MEHRMQLVCDGLATKNDVLVETIDQYKEVFTKARREINTLKDVCLHPRELVWGPASFSASAPQDRFADRPSPSRQAVRRYIDVGQEAPAGEFALVDLTRLLNL
jgi:hypothetical protein